MKKLHYGIISCATICDRFMHAILEVGDELVAIASRSLDKAQQKAQEYGIKAYGSYEELYEDTTVDIVYIATNNATHVQEIIQAIQHGKHVICEKPMALTKQDAQDVFILAQMHHVFLMEAQKSVFLPVMKDIKEHIQKCTYGQLHQIEMSSSFPNPTAPWMHDPTQGGVVYGSANYTLELLDFLLEPKTTIIQAMGMLEETGTCERISLNIQMDSVLINSRISMNGDTLQHAIFYFDQGYIHVPTYWKASAYTTVVNKQSNMVSYPIDYEMVYEVAHIHDCIQKGYIQSPIMCANRSISCCEHVEFILAQI